MPSNGAYGWGRPLRAILDTGTDPNWISPDLIEEFQLCTDEIAGTDTDYLGFVGVPFRPERQARLRWRSVTSGKEKDSTTFFVAPESVPVDIIFGKKFIVDERFVTEIDGSHIFRKHRSAQLSVS